MSIASLIAASNQKYLCLVCQNPTNLNEVQHIEQILSEKTLLEQSCIITHLEKRPQSNFMWKNEFMHQSLFNNCQTINICLTCYQSAAETNRHE